MNHTQSFRQRMESGVSPEELRAYYCIGNEQYQRILASLQEIRKNGGKK